MKCKDGSSVTLSYSDYRTFLYLFLNGILTDCRSGNLRLVTRGSEALLPIHELFGGEQEVSTVIRALELGWKYKGAYWERNGLKFKHVHFSLIEVFEYNIYGILDVKNKTVVDVGAHVGDSSIYFAKKGASLVYALEPHPKAFAELVYNVNLNELNDKIIPLNVALSPGDDYIVVPENVTIINTQATYLRGKVNGSGTIIKATSLQKLLKEYSVTPDILKMDCEGCEFDVILHEYETVTKFNELLFEYHAHVVGKPLSDLLSKLSKDFVCQKVGEEYYRDVLYQGNKLTEEPIGSLHCVKKR